LEEVKQNSKLSSANISSMHEVSGLDLEDGAKLQDDEARRIKREKKEKKRKAKKKRKSHLLLTQSTLKLSQNQL